MNKPTKEAPPIFDLGPTPPNILAQQQWFEEHAKGNLDRLESAAQTLIQLVTGLYGVLFAILALDENPDYLANPWIRLLGLGILILFFIALTAAFDTLNPRKSVVRRGNVTEMENAYTQMLERKQDRVSVAATCFVWGMALLGLLIIFILWT